MTKSKKTPPAKAAPTPGEWIQKNIQYRGEYQYRVLIRRYGFHDVHKTFETLAEAVDFRDTILAKIKLGTLVDLREAENQTFGELVVAYLKTVTPTKKGEKSEYYRLRRVVGYTSKLDGTVVIGTHDPDGEVVPPQNIAHYKLSLCDIKVALEWIDERLAEGWSRTNVDRYRQILSSVFKWGRSRGLPIVNPFDGLPLLASITGNERDRRISKEEEDAIVEALECLTYKEDPKTGQPVLDEEGRPFLRRRPPTPLTKRRSAFFRLALETACRRGELLRAVWHDKEGNEVNLEGGYIFLKDSKTGDERRIGLTDRGIEICQEVRRLGIHEGQSVFGFTEEAWKATWRRAVTAARLKYEQDCELKGLTPDPKFLADLHFHDTRHEGATQLAQILDKYDLMKQGGWRDVRSMMRYYNPSGREMRKKLVGFRRQPESQEFGKVVPLHQK